MHKASSLILGAICALALVGCGGGSGSPLLGARNPRVRVINAVPDPITVTVNGQTLEDNRVYGAYSDYTIMPNGDRTVIVSDPTTAGQLINTSELFELGQYYTLVPYKRADNSYGILNLKDVPATTTSQAQIRVVNVSDQTVDVYIHPKDTSIQPGDTPTIGTLTQGDARQDYTLPRDPGTYTITVTAAGSQTPLYERNVTVLAGEVETAVITGNTSSSTSGIIDLPSHRF